MRLFSIDNGATWTHTQAQERATLCSIAWGNNRFVAVGATSAGQGIVHVSVDGESGEDIRLGSVPLTRIVFGNGRFVAVDESGIAYVSKNGQDGQPTNCTPIKPFTPYAMSTARFSRGANQRRTRGPSMVKSGPKCADFYRNVLCMGMRNTWVFLWTERSFPPASWIVGPNKYMPI